MDDHDYVCPGNADRFEPRSFSPGSRPIVYGFPVSDQEVGGSHRGNC